MSKINTINIMINKNSNLYNEFNNNQLSNELSQYIYNQFKGLPLNSNVSLLVQHNYKMSDLEKKKLVDEIRKHFGLSIKENHVISTIEYFKRFVLLFFGILFLLIPHFLKTEYFYLLNELLSIFAWVAMWEFVDSLVFLNIKTKLESKRYLKIIKAKINFEEIKEK